MRYKVWDKVKRQRFISEYFEKIVFKIINCGRKKFENAGKILK